MMPVFFLALGLFVSGARAEEKKADPNVHTGKLVKIDGNKLTMSDKEGKNEHTHTLAADAKISCDGKECKAADLKPGTMIKVTTKDGDKTTAVKVEASTKEEKKDK
jgi:hypothetical protein